MGANNFNGNDLFGFAEIDNEDMLKMMTAVDDDISIISEALGYADGILTRDNIVELVKRVENGKEVSIIAEGFVAEDTSDNPVVIRRATVDGFEYLVTFRFDWDNNRDNYLSLSEDEPTYTRLWTDSKEAYNDAIVFFDFEGCEYKTDGYSTNERLYHVIRRDLSETYFLESLEDIQSYLYATDYDYSCNTTCVDACDAELHIGDELRAFYEFVTDDIEENINSKLYNFKVELKSGYYEGLEVIVNGYTYYDNDYKDSPECMVFDIAYDRFGYDDGFHDYCTMSDEEIDEEYTVEEQCYIANEQYDVAKEFYDDVMFIVSDEFKNVLGSWGFNMHYWGFDKEEKEYYDNFLSYFENKKNSLMAKKNGLVAA